MDKILQSLSEPPKRRKSRKPKAHRPHPAKTFFAERGVKFVKVAGVLSVHRALLCMWLNGTRPIPPDKEEELNQLVEKVRAWEKRTGKTFGPGVHGSHKR